MYSHKANIIQQLLIGPVFVMLGKLGVKWKEGFSNWVSGWLWQHRKQKMLSHYCLYDFISIFFDELASRVSVTHGSLVHLLPIWLCFVNIVVTDCESVADIYRNLLQRHHWWWQPVGPQLWCRKYPVFTDKTQYLWGSGP